MVATIICTTPTQQLTNRLFPLVQEPTIQPTYLSSNELATQLLSFLNYSDNIIKV